jgi:hypothetical protein
LTELQAAADDAARWDAQRTVIAEKLAVAQDTTFDLVQRIDVARQRVDASLMSGDVNAASEHGMAVGSMTLTLGRSQQIVQQLTNDYAAVPQSDLAQQEIDYIPVLQAISRSPKRSHDLIVPTLRRDPGSEMRALGHWVRDHPQWQNTPTPMLDRR